MVSYTGANVDFVPAKMDYDKDAFDYGSWKDTWLLNKFKPCMLHEDGTVAYYLNPYNLTQKITGGDALPDMSTADHDMDAMIEVDQIWIKEEEIDEDHFHIYLSPTKQDGFDCWTHYDKENALKDKIYVAMYLGSKDSNGKMRSLSGMVGFAKTEDGGDTELRSLVQAKGTRWDCETWSFRRLMQYVCLLLSKTTNSQAAFGWGNTGKLDIHGRAPTGAPNKINTGGDESRGWFYGCNEPDFTHHVRVLGIEDIWGNEFRLCLGFLMGTDNAMYIKMTPGTADGTTGTDYTDDPSDYSKVLDSLINEDGRTYFRIIKMKLIPGKGLFPIEFLEDREYDHYCDYYWNGRITEIRHGFSGAGYSNNIEDPGIFSISTSQSNNSIVPEMNAPIMFV